jgi:hypothetical protein
MGWLGKLAGRGSAAVAEADPEATKNAEIHSDPPLIILVNDASGRASFKLNVFPGVEAATEWVRYWFRHGSEDGISAFWALTEQPADGLDNFTETAPEALVMIRDAVRQGVVYLFSFVDMDSAQTFLREEVGRGTPLSALMMYWAVQVKRQVDRRGEIVLSPSTPPGVAAPEILEEITDESTDGWAIPQTMPTTVVRKEPAGDARALLSEAPNAYTGVAETEIDRANETFALTSWASQEQEDSSTTDANAAQETVEDDVSFEPVTTELAEETVEAAVGFDAQEIVDEAPALSFETEAVVEEAPAASFDTETVVEEVEQAAETTTVESVEVEQATEFEPVSDEDAFAEEYAETDQEVISEVVEDDPTPVAFEPDASLESLDFEATAESTEVADEVSDSTLETPEAVSVATTVAAIEPSEPTTEDDELPTPAPTTNGNGKGHVDLTETQVVVQTNGHTPEVTGHNGEGTATTTGSPNGNGHTPAEAVIEASATVAASGPLDKAAEARITAHLESNALRMRRWEVRDEPFEGFKSPPGRF